MKKSVKHYLSVFALVIFGCVYNTASASQSVFVTGASSIRVTVPQSSYTESSVIPVNLVSSNSVGPFYIYLYNYSNKSVVATSVFNLDDVKKSSGYLSFNLARSKSSLHIAPDTYKVVACDFGTKASKPACASSESIEISAEPKIESLSSSTVFPNISIDVFGSGFDSSNYAVFDNGFSYAVSVKFVSSEHLVVTFARGLPYGKHTLAIANTSSQSNKVSFDLTPIVDPIITTASVSKSGSMYLVTVKGLNMNRAYPTGVELQRDGRVVKVISPTLVNSLAISDNGQEMKFLIDQSFDLNNLFIRVYNTDTSKSLLIPLLVR